MRLWNWFVGGVEENRQQCVNPATCLPMLDGAITEVDIAGNPYGYDLSQQVSHCEGVWGGPAEWGE